MVINPFDNDENCRLYKDNLNSKLHLLFFKFFINNALPNIQEQALLLKLLIIKKYSDD